MIPAVEIINRLADSGFTIVSGVPCSYLTPLINEAIDSPRTSYVNATNEGDAIGVAAGAWLGGKTGVVMFQNSGFGNAVNPLTSLAYTLRIPMFLIVTWRGQPDGDADEPQHELMGRITPGLFDLLQIPVERPSVDPAGLTPMLSMLHEKMQRTSLPVGFLLSNKVVSGEQTPRTKPDLQSDRQLDSFPQRRQEAPRFAQDDALACIQQAAAGAAIIATTGFTGRALYALKDSPNQLYMAGSMGCVSSVSLGLAMAKRQTHVVAIDGDGAALMRLGALAMVGAEAPSNLTHVILDNAVHDSTGAQRTVSSTVDFCAIGAACGYRNSIRIGTLAQLSDALSNPLPGPTLLHVRTLPRSNRKLPRPNIEPAEVARRLKSWLGELHAS